MVLKRSSYRRATCRPLKSMPLILVDRLFATFILSMPSDRKLNSNLLNTNGSETVIVQASNLQAAEEYATNLGGQVIRDFHIINAFRSEAEQQSPQYKWF